MRCAWREVASYVDIVWLPAFLGWVVFMFIVSFAIRNMPRPPWMKYWWEREPSFMDKRKVDHGSGPHGLGWTIIAQRLLVASFIVLFAWPMISPTFCENVKCRGHNGLAPRKECLPENASGKVAPVCKPSLRVGHVEPVRPNAMNFIAGESPSDPLDEVFPIGSSTPRSRLFVAGAKQRDHMGKHSQAPRQVLGVVTLHAICEDWHVVVTEPALQVVWTGPWPSRPCP